MNDVLELPFDQYQRYRLVSDLLERVRGEGRSLSVLDVGGRTELLRSFTQDEVTLVDVEPSDAPGLVLGSGAALPFADASFDVVCAFDTLEHVPPALRESFVTECARVARGWVMLAGPYDAPRVAEAETLGQPCLRDKLRTRHRYLDEHRTHGLPDRAATEELLTGAGCRVTTVGHGNLERWFALMCVAMYLDDDPALRGLAKGVHRFYNEALYAADHSEPVYRHVVVAAKAGRELPDVDGLFAAPVLPAGSSAAFSELTQGLVAFDVEREAWRDEQKAWKKIESDLRADLDGNRKKAGALADELDATERELARLRTDLAREERDGRAAITALRQDLEAHQASLAEERAERSAHEARGDELEAELKTVRADAERVIGVLEADLAGHREALAEARGESAAQRARAEAAESEVGGLRAHAGQLETELERERTEGATVRAELDRRLFDVQAHADELARLRADEQGRAAAQQAALAEEIEALRAHAAALEADRARHAERADLHAAELAELHVVASATNERLVAATAEIERLRAELRNRWHNVRRAVSFRRPTP